MELQEFISQALLSIVNGVNDANSKNNCFELSSQTHHGKGVSGTQVKFDLAVIAERTSELGSNKGVGMKINIFSAGVGSTEKDLNKSQATQRIQFDVFINEKKIQTNAE